MKRYTLTGRSLQLIEASANGLARKQIADLLFVTENTVKTHTRRLYSQLGIIDCSRRAARATAMGIASGLLEISDVKAPGELFTFTMKREAPPFMRYQETVDVNNTGTMRLPINNNDQILGITEFSARQRTSLAWLASGKNNVEICDDPTTPWPGLGSHRNDLRSIYTKLGVANAPQALAHAAFFGVIDIDLDVLLQGNTFRPPIYEEPITVSIDRPSYRTVTIP